MKQSEFDEKQRAAAVGAVIDDLFTNGAGQEAQRLVLTSENGRDLGGWGKMPLRDKLNDLYETAYKAGGADNDRFRAVITKILRVARDRPHIWIRNAGRWAYAALHPAAEPIEVHQSVTPQTHTFTKTWGDDYTFTPINKSGHVAKMSGWKEGIRKNDYVILKNGDGTTRYQVDEIEYYKDPADMFSATVSFAPRHDVNCEV